MSGRDEIQAVLHSGRLRLAVIAIAALGMLASSPPSAGPDEPAHLSTAWYDTARIIPRATQVFPGSGEISEVEVPAILDLQPCYIQPVRDAGCIPDRASLGTLVQPHQVTTYAPFYYWVVGIGERVVAAIAGPQYADLGGRVASMLLCLLVLLVPVLLLARRRPSLPSAVLLATTPMCAFVWGVVNPSGLEIAGAAGLAIALAIHVLPGDDGTTSTPSRRDLATIGLAAFVVAAARPIGWLWVVVLAGASILILWASRKPFREVVRAGVPVAVAISPAVGFGLLWSALHPAGVTGVIATDGSIAGITMAEWAQAIVMGIPWRAWQLFGWFGWLDTPTSWALVLLLGTGWITMGLQALGTRRRKLAGALAAVGAIVVIPSVMEFAALPSLGGSWWQGRYTLPAVVGLLLLVVTPLTVRRITALEALATLNTAALAAGVAVNYFRYAYGARGPMEILANLGAPAPSPFRTLVTIACVAALAVITLLWGSLLLQDWVEARKGKPARRSSAT